MIYLKNLHLKWLMYKTYILNDWWIYKKISFLSAESTGWDMMLQLSFGIAETKSGFPNHPESPWKPSLKPTIRCFKKLPTANVMIYVLVWKPFENIHASLCSRASTQCKTCWERSHAPKNIYRCICFVIL